MSILQDIYDSEINFEISCIWDAGFVVKLGDADGFIAEGSFYTIAECEDFLRKQIIKIYPDSEFSKNNKREVT